MIRNRGIRSLGWTASAILLAILLVWIWKNEVAGPASRVQAQIPNPAEQRNQVVEQLERLNRQVDALHKLIVAGKVVVTVRGPEPTKPEPARK